jgi:hypothetical protein
MANYSTTSSLKPLSLKLLADSGVFLWRICMEIITWVSPGFYKSGLRQTLMIVNCSLSYRNLWSDFTLSLSKALGRESPSWIQENWTLSLYITTRRSFSTQMTIKRSKFHKVWNTRRRVNWSRRSQVRFKGCWMDLCLNLLRVNGCIEVFRNRWTFLSWSRWR